jgi:gliding motility-associated-like protein
MQVSGGTPDYTFSWSNGQVGLNLVEVRPGSYTITVSDANGCDANKTIVVPGPSPLTPWFSIDPAVCRLSPTGDVGAIDIYDLTGGNGTFSNDFGIKWYKQNFGYLDQFDGLWSLSQLQSGTYYSVITDAKACRDTFYYNVPFDEESLFTPGISMLEKYCYNSNASIIATPVQGSFGLYPTFEWTNLTEDPNIVVGEQQYYTTEPLTQETRIRLRVINDYGCLESVEDTIKVYPKIGPFLDRSIHPFFSDSDLYAFSNDSSVISVLADTEYTINVYTESDGDYYFDWEPADFFYSPGMGNPSYMLFQSGMYENAYSSATIYNTQTQKNEKYIPLELQVISEHFCIETINLKARILDRIRMANVFSPNGDGINDLWQVPYANKFPSLEITIVNRWGAVVWSARASDASAGWDGKNKNGKDLPTGTYYYVISFNVPGSNHWKPISGSVTIVR